MPITDTQKEMLNRMCPVAKSVGLGTEMQNLTGEVVAHQANSTATDVAGLVADFNALLAKLQAAGIMASS